MKEIKVTTHLFDFNELNENAQLKALTNEIKAIIDIEIIDFEELEDSHPFKQAYEIARRNRTPWFLESLILEKAGEYIRNDLQSNYYFLINGELFGNRDSVNKDYNLK